MEDINELINATDTDNVILNKLKELGTKLTGQENVQGETVAEVLDFINNNYSGGGSSSVGGSTEIKTYNFKLYDVNNQLREEYDVKCIDKNIFMSVYFTFLLGEFDYTNIDNNRIKIGTCTMTDNNNNNNINTYSSIPIVYQIENSNVKYNGNLKIEYDETNVGTNNIELVINTEDVQTIKNKKAQQTEGRSLMINIIGGGIFNDNIYIP